MVEILFKKSQVAVGLVYLSGDEKGKGRVSITGNNIFE